MRIVDLPRGYVLTKFDDEADFMNVLVGALWLVFGHYVPLRSVPPIKVDHKTLFANRGHFARICVELDLTKPLKGRCTKDYTPFVFNVVTSAIFKRTALKILLPWLG
ncbi:hypothetical protein V2J09_016741 [Rumex salicifolius]